MGVASLPESYAERLTEISPASLRRLRLFAMEPHDLALSKLTRNSPIDRHDVAQLTKVFRTLDMWIDAYFGPQD